MPNDKTICKNCRAEILTATANRTDGLCMPCKNGTPKRAELKEPVKVLCLIDSGGAADVTVQTTAQALLAELEKIRHIGDSMHPNKFEMDAQKALLRHAIRHRIEIRLHDDHWGRTMWALLKLFEEGQAQLLLGDSTYGFSDLIKEDWKEGTKPLMSHGGILYRNEMGEVLFKTMSWIS